MSVESLSHRRNQHDAARLAQAAQSASITSLQQWTRMRNASAEASAWDDLDALARGYGFEWWIGQQSGRCVGELWSAGHRHHRVSAPTRVLAVEMLVAWLEATS